MAKYQVLKPLNGYGYIIGDVTDKIKKEDAERFLSHKLIAEVAEEKAPKAKK